MNFATVWIPNDEVWVGAAGSGWANRAWTGNEFPEYLDFSHGYSYKAANNERHSINGNDQYGFATNSLGKGPRVLVHSPTMTFFNDKSKGWSGAGNFEEFVIDCSNLNWGASWSGPDKQSQRIVYNFASMPTGYANMIYPNNNNYFGGESDWSEVTLTKMTKVLKGCFSHFDAKGTLVLPAVQVVSNTAFSSCRYMEEAKLGETSKSLKQLWTSAFSDCSRLKRVTLGGADGFTFKSSNVFASCPLEEVTFTGKVPTSDVFANLLGNATAAATKPVKVYASANMGWDTFAYMDAPTDAERAEAPGETVLGVYRGGAAAPSGKALVIHRESPFDPRGMTILLR